MLSKKTEKEVIFPKLGYFLSLQSWSKLKSTGNFHFTLLRDTFSFTKKREQKEQKY